MKIFGTFLFVAMTYSTCATAVETKQIFQLAEAKKTTNSRAWKKLLHIERNFFGIPATQIADDKFLLSNSPEFNTDNELHATLLAFQVPAEKVAQVIPHPLKQKADLKITDHSQHAQCRFPARLKYLKTELADATEFWNLLPKVNCTYQTIFLDSLSPKAVSFVFSSYYADSPGSAFGHTFFRINRHSQQTKIRQELLDFGIGFAANVTVTNPAAYALMGLFGGFSGAWTNLPYYYKVREYNDYEARDLWSYDLNLSASEVEMFALHIWEVGAHAYNYFFFTQNCAYHMLTVLEAAAPRLHLIEHVPFYYIIPADSMKALFFEKDFVKGFDFRPSARKVFLERTKRLDKTSLSEFEAFADTEVLPTSVAKMDDNQKALFLDAAIDLVDLRHPQLDAKKNKDLYQKKESLLAQRALVNVVTPELVIPPHPDSQPELSHGSSRLGLSFFESSKIKTGFLNYRFALHDLQDPTIGMPKFSQLEFFNFNFQALPNDLHFKEMNLFKVFNLSPRNFFEKKASWGFELGVQNKNEYCSPSDADCYLTGFLAKYGTAIHLFNEDSVAWALGAVNGRYGATLLDSKYFLAPGFEFGLLYRFAGHSSILATFAREYPLARSYQQNYHIEFRQTVSTNFSLGIQAKNDVGGISAYYFY